MMDWIKFKNDILESSESDFIFSNVLVGDVRYYLGKNTPFKKIKETTIKLITELMQEEKVVVYFVNETNKQKATYKSEIDIKRIVNRIKDEWDLLGDSELLPNQLIWLKHKKSEDIELHSTV
jgi:hypothetical protein